jgi:hypothetical protein
LIIQWDGNRKISHNQALDAEPPIASFLKSMSIGGGPVNAAVELSRLRWRGAKG